MIEFLTAIIFILMAVRFRAACEERELRDLQLNRSYDLIKHHGNSEVAILALHGFGVCPQMYLPWLQQWRSNDWSFMIPMLTGSTNSIYAFEESNHKDWEYRALAAFDQLQARYSKVYIVGFSFGGLVALRVAQERKPEGIVLLAPFFGLCGPMGKLAEMLISKFKFPSKTFVPNRNLDCSDSNGVKNLFRFKHSPMRAVANLFKLRNKVINADKVSCGVFWSHSNQDHVASFAKSAYYVEKLSSAVHKLPLKNSYHYLLHDVDSIVLEDAVLSFIKQSALKE